MERSDQLLQEAIKCKDRQSQQETEIFQTCIIPCENQVGFKKLNLNYQKALKDEIKVFDLSQQLSQFTNLEKLKILLEGNNLNDQHLKMILKGIKQMRFLQKIGLFLNQNQISDKSLIKIGKSIQSMQNLIEIRVNLSQNKDLTSMGLVEFSKYVQQSTINSLIIILDRQLIDQNFILVCQNLSENKNLSRFGLELCFYGIEEGFCQLIQGLFHLKKMDLLYIKDAYQKDNSLKIYSKQIKTLSLALQKYSIEQKQIEEILQFISNQGSIDFFNFQINIIDKIDLQQFSHTLTLQKQLKHLKLDFNNYSFDEQQMQSFFKFLDNLNNLQSLDTKFNIEPNTTFSVFGQFFEKLKMLRVLKISIPQMINYQQRSCLYENILKLTNLQELIISTQVIHFFERKKQKPCKIFKRKLKRLICFQDNNKSIIIPI